MSNIEIHARQTNLTLVQNSQPQNLSLASNPTGFDFSGYFSHLFPDLKDVSSDRSLEAKTKTTEEAEKSKTDQKPKATETADSTSNQEINQEDVDTAFTDLLKDQEDTNEQNLKTDQKLDNNQQPSEAKQEQNPVKNTPQFTLNSPELAPEVKQKNPTTHAPTDNLDMLAQDNEHPLKQPISVPSEMSPQDHAETTRVSHEILDYLQKVDELSTSEDNTFKELNSSVPETKTTELNQTPEVTQTNFELELTQDDPLTIMEKKILALEAAEIEAERLHESDLKKQRAFDDLRIQTQVIASDKVGSQAQNQSAFHQNAGQDQSFQSGLLTHSKKSNQNTQQSSFEQWAALSLAKTNKTKGSESQSPVQIRKSIVETVEKIRKMLRSRQVSRNQLSLTIQLEDVDNLKLNLRPLADGSHEIAFLAGHERTKNQLKRIQQDILDIASELPFKISDVIVALDSETSANTNPRSEQAWKLQA